MLRFLAVIVFSLFLTVVKAQQHFSYVYIQGDKETPFYVKYEDEMLPRFGKNYYIISELAPGPVNIEVLFQQNVYAPQKFTVNVPDNGFRGFLLTKKGADFSLYDIHRQFYIPAGNKAGDDNYTAYTAGTPTVPVDDITPVVPQDAQPVVKKTPSVAKTTKPATSGKTAKPVVAKTPKTSVKVPTGKTDKTKESTNEPVFLDNVELKSDRTGNTLPAGGVAKNSLATTNSDCPRALSNDAFDNIYKKAITKSTSGKLKYLLDKIEGNCYTSNQVRQLTQILPGDNERYTYLKKVYPRVTDQSAFKRLENLLTADEWKEYFRSLVQPQ
ncbi:DUF4476 domain-containing protein [Polluticoccus soli]|uniref:DUF4476 domain-containing protein n=1 Tax=Polluticoccus soli TaxID=3034150 RepID=UPI0023E1C6FF|nr:DUF4476 domain-containing protein [Flavipsychrobacter sp. JY13-12]